MKNKSFKDGILLVETLISVFIFSVILSVLININNLYMTSVSSGLKSAKAMYLAEEGLEAARILRDTSWQNFQNLTESKDYYFYFSNEASSTWMATTSIVYKSIEGVDRWLVLESVKRVNDRIVESGGLIDPDTKKITVFVSWSNRNSRLTKSFSTYLTKIIPE